MKVKVKICGIKTVEAAKAAFDAGADFLGFNFVPISKRYIKPEISKKISSRHRSNNIKFVGVFMNEELDIINKLIDNLKLDYVQLHGDESPEYLRLIKGAKIIKTFSLKSDFDVDETIKKLENYTAEYFLLDRQVQGQGEILNLEKVRQLSAISPIILSGGLAVENLAESVREAKPQVVDVAAGVETNGEKDIEKIKRFVKEAKKYDI